MIVRIERRLDDGHHVMEDVGHKAGVDPTSVGNQVLATFVHIHGAH